MRGKYWILYLFACFHMNINLELLTLVKINSYDFIENIGRSRWM